MPGGPIGQSNKDIVDELRLHRRPPWQKDPLAWIAIAAFIISLLALFRDYLGWQYRHDDSNKVETKPTVIK